MTWPLLVLFTMMAVLFLNSACGTVTIKNHELCGDKGSLGAKCYYTASAGEETLSKPAWDDKRFGMICMSAAAVLDDKQALEKLCSQSKKCVNDPTILNARAVVGKLIEEMYLEAQQQGIILSP